MHLEPFNANPDELPGDLPSCGRDPPGPPGDSSSPKQTLSNGLGDAVPRRPNLTDLPEELLDNIIGKLAEETEVAAPWLSRMSKMSRQFNRITEPHLYASGGSQIVHQERIFWALHKGLPEVIKKDIRWGDGIYTLGTLKEVLEYGHNDIAKMLIALRWTQDKLRWAYLKRDARHEGERILSFAAENGITEVVEALLAVDGVLAESAGSREYEIGMTPLAEAACQGHVDVCRLLLAKGADPSMAVRRAIQGMRSTPLPESDDRAWRRREVLRLLLNHGADPNRGIAVAIRYDFVDCLEMLLENGGVNVNVVQDFTSRVVLMEDLDSSNRHYLMPLRLAALHCNNEDSLRHIQLLLQFGAELNAHCPHWGDTPLHAAKNAMTARFLLEHGADVNALNEYDETPLYEARDLDHIQLLIDHGAAVDHISTNHDTVLHRFVLEAKNGQDQVDKVRYLLHLGLEKHINSPNLDGLTALHLAVRRPVDSRLVMLLLEHGADINARDARGRTPLITSEDYCRAYQNYRYRHVALPQAFFDYGPDMNACANDGSTALTMALKWRERTFNPDDDADDDDNDSSDDGDRGGLPIYPYYYDRDDVERAERERRRRWDEKQSQGAYERIEQLLERGADPSKTLAGQKTCLHVAAAMGWLNVVQLLVENGAEIDAADEKGRTPLMAACWWHHDDISKWLLRRGASRAKMDHRGGTAVEYRLGMIQMRELYRWMKARRFWERPEITCYCS
ncbi:hypothetical protein ACO1O0_002352 [Amphichorda felina]